MNEIIMDVHQDQMDSNVVELPIEQTNLQHLNEDCLLEIFSSNSLTPVDLLSLAETCTLFKRVTQRVFPKEFSIEAATEHAHTFESKSDKSAEVVERILLNFGSRISTLSIRQNRRTDPAVVNSVAKYCSDGTLKRLSICDMDYVEDLRVKFESIFQRLLVLSMRQCMARDSTDLQFRCDSLIELEIIHVKGGSAILMNTFPKLERFTFVPDQDEKCNEAGFIERHKSLRTLSLKRSSYLECYEIVHAICNSCKELEELVLGEFISLDFSQLESLKQLRMLDVGCIYGEYDNIVKILRALKSLEIVKLYWIELCRDENCVLLALSQLQHLRELHLTGCFYEHVKWTMLSRLRKLVLVHFYERTVLLDIISQLTNLEELEIRHDFILIPKEVSDIVKIVERSPNQIRPRVFVTKTKNLY